MEDKRETSTSRTAELRAQAAAFREFVLAKPPTEPRSLELWMQHGVGFILFEKVRAAGLATLDPSASRKIRSAVELAVDNTMYALMMLIDGVTGGLAGNDHNLDLAFSVELRRGGSLVRTLDLRHGDGACMGFHSWIEGDYGSDPIIEPSIAKTE